MTDEKKIEEKRKLVKSYVTEDGAQVEEYVGPNKPEHTTFVINRGTKIDIDLPDVIVSPGLIPADVTSPAEMGETLDLHSAFTWEKFLAEGVDAHFNARTVTGTVAEAREATASPSDYWFLDSYIPPFYGYLVCPAELRAVAVYSKKAFKHPIISVGTKLPSLIGFNNNTQVWMGFETGAAGDIAAFRWSTQDGGVSEVLHAWIGAFGFPWRSIDITNLLPADHKTVRHRYRVECNRAMAVFYIDFDVVAYGLITPNSFITSIVGPPYGLFSMEVSIPARLTSLLEVNSLGTPQELRFEVSPFNVRIGDGDPLPPRVLRLYDAGTEDLFTSLTIAAGSETSHPFPIFGFQEKTINFRASEQGTLSVEVLKQTDNWREYDTMGITQDKAKTYSIEGEAVLARVVYTPNTYPCTISEAEVVLR